MATVDMGVSIGNCLSVCNLRTITLNDLIRLINLRNLIYGHPKVKLAEIAITWETIKECRKQFGVSNDQG